MSRIIRSFKADNIETLNSQTFKLQKEEIIEEILQETDEEILEEFQDEGGVKKFRPEIISTKKEDSELEAERIVKDALETASQIVRDANIRAAAVEKEGFDKGVELGKVHGYEVGVEQALIETKAIKDAEIQKLKHFITNYIREVTEEKEKLLEFYLDDLKNISLAIGEKIVQTSLKSSSDIISKMIISATEKMKKVAWAKIYIGGMEEGSDIQGDAEFIKNISRLADNVKIVFINEDEPGTCIVETPDEILDISVKTQLESIKEILNNARAT